MSDKLQTVVKKQIKGRFVKGKSGNPKGREKGSKNFFTLGKLYEAIKSVEDDKKIDYFKYIIERSLDSDKILIALMHKIIPSVVITKIEDEDLKDRELTLYDLPKNGGSEELAERFKRFMQ